MSTKPTTINGILPNANFYGHTCENTAITSKDYPWGFKLRTSQRYWVETRESKGQRFVYQTLNPKTGNWCKPKKSTYTNLVVLGSNEKGYIHYSTIGMYSEVDKIQAFQEKHGENLTKYQLLRIKTMLLAHKLHG